MFGARDGARDQLQETSSAQCTVPRPSSHDALASLSISAQTYDRLLSLADQAPLECLALSDRTLASAKILGYNQIGQVRSTPLWRLSDDFGQDRAEELRRALNEYGLRELAVTHD